MYAHAGATRNETPPQWKPICHQNVQINKNKTTAFIKHTTEWNGKIKFLLALQRIREKLRHALHSSVQDFQNEKAVLYEQKVSFFLSN